LGPEPNRVPLPGPPKSSVSIHPYYNICQQQEWVEHTFRKSHGMFGVKVDVWMVFHAVVAIVVGFFVPVGSKLALCLSVAGVVSRLHTPSHIYLIPINGPCSVMGCLRGLSMCYQISIDNTSSDFDR
jgi:hypothetical protein